MILNAERVKLVFDVLELGTLTPDSFDLMSVSNVQVFIYFIFSQKTNNLKMSTLPFVPVHTKDVKVRWTRKQ